MQEYLIWVILVLLLYIARKVSCVHDQNQDIQFQINKLLESQGVELGKAVEPSEHVKHLARTKGSEIEAIKAYREQTGVSLKEAMAVVQAISKPASTDA